MVRVYGDALEVPPPKQLPRWMVAANYQEQPQGTTTSGTATPLVNAHHAPIELWTHVIDSSMDMYDKILFYFYKIQCREQTTSIILKISRLGFVYTRIYTTMTFVLS